VTGARRKSDGENIYATGGPGTPYKSSGTRYRNHAESQSSSGLSEEAVTGEQKANLTPFWSERHRDTCDQTCECRLKANLTLFLALVIATTQQAKAHQA